MGDTFTVTIQLELDDSCYQFEGITEGELASLKMSLVQGTFGFLEGVCNGSERNAYLQIMFSPDKLVSLIVEKETHENRTP